MSDNKDFKEGLKATSLFGGVQIINILIRIVRSKFIAVLLGPEGMGINGLLNSATLMINGFTGLGLGISAVKDISEAHASGNSIRVSRTFTILKKLVWLTGSLGFLACFISSPLLSKLSFGNYEYTTAFMLVSITLLFMQIASGQNAIMQGTRHFADMAKAGVLGSLLGLFTTIPIYYFWGLNGIVPALIVASFTTVLISYYYSRRIHCDRVYMTYKDALLEGRKMINLGFYISLQTLFSLLAGYIIRIFISCYGGLTEVGLFVAGFVMIDTYVGMVFSAMGTEYYPRLASHSNGTIEEFSNTINQQIEISLILVSPLICLFLIFGNYAILLLYSEKFLPITMMLCLAMVSNYFKGPAWCIAYSFLSKGDTKAFMINELLAVSFNTVTKLLFYYWWGLTGIGAAFIVCYLVYLMQVSYICHYKYGYTINVSKFKFLFIQLLFGIICLSINYYLTTFLRLFIGSIIVLLSVSYSYVGLQRHLDISIVLKRIIKR